MRRVFSPRLLPLLSVVLLGLGVKVVEAQRGGASSDVHDPANAVANLEVHPGLQATLFASEPAITNPTNLDIDARGRVWICDVMNYRGNNGKRPEGDRIMILEDTDNDGQADKVKTYYQGRDVDSAMGICVLGNKVIVSCSPNVLIFTDDNGDDKPDKKEVFFSNTGQPQHDHSAHSFLFGPDGKLYWNFGNTGKAVHDREDKPVVDLAGNRVVDNGRPYFGGMPFRCNLDGSAFEVLAHNFRNNYETTVDSFGTLWQSDNDDDGNRGVRINYVMEFGNFGYLDEMTGEAWRTPRTNLESEVPLQHWHLNDPGVVPNLLQTGAGSPTGICVYEGDLLPKVFHNHVIHCDAGPSVVRAYPVQRDGAGYSATLVNILDGQKKNNWFRPADVCVAPDGSLFVTDWYDPGVGGHGQRDINRGRIFRVAPPGHKYKVPTYDYATPEGAAKALENPNLAVRYLAWTALHDMKDRAEPALEKLWQSDNPRYRARALWLLGKREGRGEQVVERALNDRDPDIRVTGLRLARQLGLDLAGSVKKVVHDPSAQVRRECAIALRHCKSPEAPMLWAELAKQHEPGDRWYLEALGIGANQQWDRYLDAWLKAVGERWSTPAGRDILWRSRARSTAEYLTKIIADPAVPTDELPRYFRAFDFQNSEGKDDLLAQLAFSGKSEGKRQDLIIVEAVGRLRSLDLSKNPAQEATLQRLLDRNKGSELFVTLVEKLQIASRYPDLVVIAQQHPEDQLGINALRVLLDRRQFPLVTKALNASDPEAALNMAKALGTLGDNRITGPLLAVLKDDKKPAELRRQVVRSLARSHRGAQEVVAMARGRKLSAELKGAASGALHQAQWRDVQTAAAELFPLPASKNEVPLPPINELVKRTGNPNRGQALFAKEGTCANCHKVNGEGKEVGPDLSEIGKKLGREALFESILFPSASISHNYETYTIETKNGLFVNGVLVSQTPAEVTLKDDKALVRSFLTSQIASMSKAPTSLMPADLHKALTPADLADVVEYLLTLKEIKKPVP